MTDERKQSILNALAAWFKSNAAVIIAFGSLSWQISSKLGGAAYTRVTSFVDTVEITRDRVLILQTDVAKFKADQKVIDDGQNIKINRLLTQIPK